MPSPEINSRSLDEGSRQFAAALLYLSIKFCRNPKQKVKFGHPGSDAKMHEYNRSEAGSIIQVSALQAIPSGRPPRVQVFDRATPL